VFDDIGIQTPDNITPSLLSPLAGSGGTSARGLRYNNRDHVVGRRARFVSLRPTSLRSDARRRCRGRQRAVTAKIHQVQPEQVGAQTGELFEYQYHQAANATLLLLDGDIHSVYCEWHDDFVTESVADEYEFHQVKTRTKKQGPWRISDFFGTPRKTTKKKPDAADATSFFLKMFHTWRQFEPSTRKCVFVSDNVLDATFQALVDLVQSSSDVTAVASDSWFKFIVDTVSQVEPDVTADTLYKFLRVFTLQPALGASEDLKGCRAMIADRMVEVSEVEVQYGETRHMTVALVSMIRKKSHHKGVAPVNPDALRNSKAVTLPELLSLLSLSPEGYRELKQTGRDAVRTLSRLHRWCKSLGFPDDSIPLLCSLKAQWHVWFLANRHALSPVDLLTLRSGVQKLLLGQSRPGGSIDTLIEQAKLLAEKHAPTLATNPPLTREIVVGLALDMAVMAQKAAGGDPP